MTQETLEVANELLSQIKRTTNELKVLHGMAAGDAFSSQGFNLEFRFLLNNSQQSLLTKDESIYREVYRLLINKLTSKLEQLTIAFEAL